jgi:hypothetical protein
LEDGATRRERQAEPYIRRELDNMNTDDITVTVESSTLGKPTLS